MTCIVGKINWAPGQLRWHESRVSFLSRFFKLNGIKSKVFQRFLAVETTKLSDPSKSDVSLISSLLGEPLEIVESIFDSGLNLSFGDIRVRSVGRHRKRMMYCPECILIGFHSHVHDETWLRKCAFHQVPLIMVPGSGDGGLDSLIKSFSTVAESACTDWPWRPRNEDSADPAIFDQFRTWLKAARSDASRTSAGVYWVSPNTYGVNEGDIIGQLQVNVPMPPCVSDMLAVPVTRWNLSTFRYSGVTDFCGLGISAGTLNLFLRYFHLISSYSKRKPKFYEVLRRSQESLRRWHRGRSYDGFCLCEWERWPQFSSHIWLRRDLSMLGTPRQCPVEHSVAHLEEEWGEARRVLSARSAFEQKLSFLNEAENLLRLKLVKFTDDAAFLENGRLSAYGQPEYFCEWTGDKALTELLEAVTTLMIEDEALQLQKWLHDVDIGQDPNSYSAVPQSVRVYHDCQGVAIQCWQCVDLMEAVDRIKFEPIREDTSLADVFALKQLQKELREERIIRFAEKYYDGF